MSTLARFGKYGIAGIVGYIIHELFPPIFPQKQTQKVPQIVAKSQLDEFDERYGLPSHQNVQEYDAFISSTNYERRIPNWSLQVIQKHPPNSTDVEVDRKFSNFTNSIPGLPSRFKASNDDYLRSGWSRGHLCPAGDAKSYSQNAMNETFYLNSNIVPQNLSNNVDFWYRIETFVRKQLGNDFDKVSVVSGPLFLPREEEGKKYVKYQVIGKNNVAVPTHLFKVILAEKDDKKWIDAFLVPNEPIKGKSLLDYRENIDMIEKSAGLQFFPKIEPNGKLCENYDCKLMNDFEFDEIQTIRKIDSFKTKADLEEFYKKLKDEQKTSNFVIQTYQKKIKELKE